MARRAISALRFCQTPEELPLAQLYDFRRFEIAISRVEQSRRFPEPDWLLEQPRAIGLLHAGGVFDDGTATPVLPVALHFDVSPDAPAKLGCLGEGILDCLGFDDARHYVLDFTIADPAAEIFATVSRALERAALGGYNYTHLHCVRDQKPEQGRSLLAAPDGNWPPVVFDSLGLTDACVSKAPSWSWAWRDAEVRGDQRFLDKRVARYRSQAARSAVRKRS